MPHAKVFIHFVWTTKNGFPFLDTLTLRKNLWSHIHDNALKKGISIDRINGYREHCHCLISLGNEQCMSNVMQLLKGESSHWMNKNFRGKHKFEWQDGYYAASVSPSSVDYVRRYIDKQEEHHGKRSFQDEYEKFMKESGFEAV